MKRGNLGVTVLILVVVVAVMGVMFMWKSASSPTGEAVRYVDTPSGIHETYQQCRLDCFEQHREYGLPTAGMYPCLRHCSDIAQGKYLVDVS